MSHVRRLALAGLLGLGLISVAPAQEDPPPAPPPAPPAGDGAKPADKPADSPPGGEKPADPPPGGEKPPGGEAPPGGEKPPGGENPPAGGDQPAQPPAPPPRPPHIFAPIPDEPMAAARILLRSARAPEAAAKLAPLASAPDATPDVLLLWQDAVTLSGGDPAPVADVFRRIASAKPDDAFAQCLPPRLLAPKEAATAFEHLTPKFAGSPWPLAGRARAMERMGRLTDALKYYDAAIAAAPAEARFRAGRALVLEQMGNWADARDEWQRVVDANADDVAAKLGVGEALRHLEDREGAAGMFTIASLALPDDPEPHLRLGLLRLDESKWDEAVASFEDALDRDARLIPAYCGAARAAARKVDDAARAAKQVVNPTELERALGFAQKAVDAAPDSPEPYIARGTVHEIAGDGDAARWDAALADYGAALDRIPIPGAQMVRVLIAKSHVLNMAGRADEAVAAALRATEIEPKNETAWAFAGDALVEAGKDEDAIKRVWRPGLKALPDSARLHHALGMSLWRTEKVPEAAKEFKEATKLDPNEGRWRLSYGEFLYQTNKEKDAAVELQLATTLRPDDPVAWSCYGHALVSTQQWKEAAEAYEKACALNDQAVDEHLALAVIYADRLKDKDKGRTHAKTWRDRGGTESVLDGWIDGLLSGK